VLQVFSILTLFPQKGADLCIIISLPDAEMRLNIEASLLIQEEHTNCSEDGIRIAPNKSKSQATQPVYDIFLMEKNERG
jgi:hypothetical protein